MTGSQKSLLWVIGATVLTTSLMLVLLQNFETPKKELERKPGRLIAGDYPKGIIHPLTGNMG